MGEEEEEGGTFRNRNVANRSLGRRKATSIHNTNKITTTTTTTPTKTNTAAESSHSSFPSLAASGLQIDSESISPTSKTDPLLSLPPTRRKKERKKDEYKTRLRLRRRRRKLFSVSVD